MSEDSKSKKPSHEAFQVSDGPEDKSYFNRIGAAFEHGDKKGYNILLNSVPVDGRITLRAVKEQTQEGNADKGQTQSEEQEIER